MQHLKTPREILMNKFIFTGILLILFACVQAQDSSRAIAAIRTNLPVKIDGNLNDEAWKNASHFTNFTEMKPSFGRNETEATQTDAWLLYDDEAVYISGFCRESTRDSISTELVGRDVLGVNDFVGILFDSYLDKINGVGFYVTALGEQYDTKYSLGYEDASWSSVYETATRITDSGWVFEMRIPYAALRFSKKTVQNWGVNFIRKRNKPGRQVSWNPIDPNKFGTMNQAGMLTGIANIKSPVRLSFMPYFSTYVNKTPQQGGGNEINASVNGGMDVKYGLSKGFTLDVTLIPDFGQVQSDNQVLNLSPFEVKFNENRSFFTEGTELFNKGNLFYSRRVGGQPINLYKPYEIADSTEQVIKNPSETKLLNATKLSGRTAGGLGIGVFNAVTNPQSATIMKANGDTYQVETAPMTNYNIVVLDQTMKNNSSVTLVNTNVLRNGSEYDANVTAALFDLYDKKINWNVWGKVANSRLSGGNFTTTSSGILYDINFGKFRGPFNFEVHHQMADDKFQPNDLGYFTNNNYMKYGFNAWYKFNKPRLFYNSLRFSLKADYIERYKPRQFQELETYLQINSQLKNLWEVGIKFKANPEGNDFYEARTFGRVFKNPGIISGGFYANSNRAKKYAFDLDVKYQLRNRFNGKITDIFLSNKYRFNDRLTITLTSFNTVAHNDFGFAYKDANDVFVGLRKRTTVENIANFKYNFNIKMGLSLRARHYWSKVHYQQYFILEDNGETGATVAPTFDANRNSNYFNVDMVYTWQFALGSFINIGWKNAGLSSDKLTESSYYKNLEGALNSEQESNFSVKVIYFLDYLMLKKSKRKNK